MYHWQMFETAGLTAAEARAAASTNIEAWLRKRP